MKSLRFALLSTINFFLKPLLSLLFAYHICTCEEECFSSWRCIFWWTIYSWGHTQLSVVPLSCICTILYLCLTLSLDVAIHSTPNGPMHVTITTATSAAYFHIMVYVSLGLNKSSNQWLSLVCQILKLEHEWVITYHILYWKWFLIHGQCWILG